MFPASDSDAPPPSNDRLPGDITVTPLRHGYLIGRVLPQRGPGPWWEYVGIETDVEGAIELARHLARRDNVRAWLFDGCDRYEQLPLDQPHPALEPEPRQDADADDQKAIIRTKRVSAPPSVNASQRSRRR